MCKHLLVLGLDHGSCQPCLKLLVGREGEGFNKANIHATIHAVLKLNSWVAHYAIII